FAGILEIINDYALRQRFPTRGPLITYWWAAEHKSRVQVGDKESESTIK
ncbi:hypothetical protein AVEN_103881-2-1, partial [Araneus ventricosus]